MVFLSFMLCGLVGSEKHADSKFGIYTVGIRAHTHTQLGYIYSFVCISFSKGEAILDPCDSSAYMKITEVE